MVSTQQALRRFHPLGWCSFADAFFLSLFQGATRVHSRSHTIQKSWGWILYSFNHCYGSEISSFAFHGLSDVFVWVFSGVSVCVDSRFFSKKRVLTRSLDNRIRVILCRHRRFFSLAVFGGFADLCFALCRSGDQQLSVSWLGEVIDHSYHQAQRTDQASHAAMINADDEATACACCSWPSWPWRRGIALVNSCTQTSKPLPT
jgi:hypothetical protein